MSMWAGLSGAMSALFIASAAFAEEVEWREPLGRYTLRYDDAAWRSDNDVRADDEMLVLRQSIDDDERLRRCVVRRRPFSALAAMPTLDQDKLNNFIATAYSEEGARAFFRDATVQAVSRDRRDGVTVANIALVAHTPGADVTVRYRIFALMAAEAAEYHELRCDSPGPIEPGAFDAMDTILESLRFSH